MTVSEDSYEILVLSVNCIWQPCRADFITAKAFLYLSGQQIQSVLGCSSYVNQNRKCVCNKNTHSLE